MSDNPAGILHEVWQAGVAAVDGYRCVENFLAAYSGPSPTLIVAVGKAAEPMYLAAATRFGADIPKFVATKYNHLSALSEGPSVISAGHPTPDENSERAGRTLMSMIESAGADARLLMLVSGGASAIVELPEAGWCLSDIVTQNNRLVAGGFPIGEMNAARKKSSAIKGGKLLARFGGTSVLTLALSDVEGDCVDVIGSGIGAYNGTSTRYRCEIVGSNRIARAAAEKQAVVAGFEVIENVEMLYTDVEVAAKLIDAKVKSGRSGIYIFGGEPTVKLPQNPGRGGRNQALALHLARHIAGTQGIKLLVAGTDGTDGPTNAAGAVVDGTTWRADAADALNRADSWSWLDQRGALYITGPTGTNVMDLVVAQVS